MTVWLSSNVCTHGLSDLREHVQRLTGTLGATLSAQRFCWEQLVDIKAALDNSGGDLSFGHEEIRGRLGLLIAGHELLSQPSTLRKVLPAMPLDDPTDMLVEALLGNLLPSVAQSGDAAAIVRSVVTMLREGVDDED